MTRCLFNNPSLRIPLIALAAACLLVAVACDNNPSSPSGGCVVVTGNTTTSFGASGGTGSIDIRTPATCTWGAVSNASFVTVTSGASGAGDGTVTFAVAANTGPVRVAVLTITDTNDAFPDTAITITQSAP